MTKEIVGKTFKVIYFEGFGGNTKKKSEDVSAGILEKFSVILK